MDLRVKKTYRALIGALIELMEERSFDDITVAALCERAEIRRTTFYKHFADKYEFFDFALQNLWGEFREQVRRDPGDDTLYDYGVGTMREFMQFLAAHEGLVDNIISSGMYSTAVVTMRDVLTRNVALLLEEERRAGAQLLASPETEAAFIAGGVMETVRCWWVAGRPDDVTDDIVRVFGALLEQSGIKTPLFASGGARSQDGEEPAAR